MFQSATLPNASHLQDAGFSDNQFWSAWRSSYGPGYERAGFPFMIAKSDAGGGPLAHEFIAAKAIHLKGNEKEMKWMASLFMQHLLKDHHGTDQQNN
jgi:hypothetical protein